MTGVGLNLLISSAKCSGEGIIEVSNNYDCARRSMTTGSECQRAHSPWTASRNIVMSFTGYNKNIVDINRQSVAKAWISDGMVGV
jgi:hypothetical protein